MWYALFLSWMGRHEEATTEINKALELDPLSLLINANYPHVLYFKRQYDEVIKNGLKAVEMDPNFLLSYWYLSLGYLGKGMWKEMIEVLKKTVVLSEESPFFLGYLGFGYAQSGQKEKAQKIIDRLGEISKTKYDSPFNKGMILLGLNEKDQALEHLEKSYEERAPVVASIKDNPFFDSIREDPRFKALQKKMSLE